MVERVDNDYAVSKRRRLAFSPYPCDSTHLDRLRIEVTAADQNAPAHMEYAFEIVLITSE